MATIRPTLYPTVEAARAASEEERNPNDRQQAPRLWHLHIPPAVRAALEAAGFQVPDTEYWTYYPQEGMESWLAALGIVAQLHGNKRTVKTVTVEVVRARTPAEEAVAFLAPFRKPASQGGGFIVSDVRLRGIVDTLPDGPQRTACLALLPALPAKLEGLDTPPSNGAPKNGHVPPTSADPNVISEGDPDDTSAEDVQPADPTATPAVA